MPISKTGSAQRAPPWFRQAKGDPAGPRQV